MMERNSRILVVSSQGFISRAIAESLESNGYRNIMRWPENPSELLSTHGVDAYFSRNKPEYVFLLAGKSAGIMGNIKFPAELMLNNLLIVSHIIDASYRYGVKKLLFLASNCCYPKDSPQPMSENLLLSGPLEETNESYAVAKIAGLKLAQSYRKQYKSDFICGIPANSFGPGDDFSAEYSHVLGALIYRIHEAKKGNMGSVVIWGTGRPVREFIYIDDLADVCIFVMNNYSGFEPINLASGGGLSIGELAQMVKAAVGFKGELVFDASKPDGMPVKLLDTSKLKVMGWVAAFSFKEALDSTYAWFLGQIKE